MSKDHPSPHASQARRGPLKGGRRRQAVRGREDVDRQHSMVVPLPSPGDRMLEDGVAVIERARPEEDDG